MSTFLQLFLRSIETGAVYALATLGIIVVFRTNLVINFAQGVMGMFGTYVITVLFVRRGLPIVAAIALGLVICVGIGFLVDFFIIRRTKKVDGSGKEIITLGLMMVFVGITPMLFGVDPLKLPKVIETGSFTLGGANLSYNSLLNIIIGLGLTTGLFLLLQKTKLGLAIRSTASNERTARLMGVPTKNITLFACGQIRIKIILEVN